MKKQIAALAFVALFVAACTGTKNAANSTTKAKDMPTPTPSVSDIKVTTEKADAEKEPVKGEMAEVPRSEERRVGKEC